MKLIAVLVGLLASSLLAAEKKEKAYVDPAQAPADFKIQGEYLSDGQAEKIGAQVAALGDGKLRLLILPGGLPGAGWNGKGNTILDGKAQGDSAEFTGPNGAHASISGATLKLALNKGAEQTLKKTERHSPTEGAKPPEGAKVLFDGKEPTELEGAKIVQENLLGPGTTTKFSVTDFVMHVEFRTPFMPSASGQARGNSGVYIQRRYEMQILDSFGHHPPLINDIGAIYQQVPPLVNACLPPLSWQTYDIDFTAARWEGDKKVKNARVTLKLNGITVQDDTEIKNKTGQGQPEGPNPMPILLQNHGDPVAFRNVWIVEKK